MTTPAPRSSPPNSENRRSPTRGIGHTVSPRAVGNGGHADALGLSGGDHVAVDDHQITKLPTGVRRRLPGSGTSGACCGSASIGNCAAKRVRARAARPDDCSSVRRASARAAVAWIDIKLCRITHRLPPLNRGQRGFVVSNRRAVDLELAIRPTASRTSARREAVRLRGGRSSATFSATSVPCAPIARSSRALPGRRIGGSIARHIH